MRRDLKGLDDLEMGDLWTEAQRRIPKAGLNADVEPSIGSRAPRVVAGLVAAVIAVVSMGFAFAAFNNIDEDLPRLPTSPDVTLVDLGDQRNWHGPLVSGDGAMWVVGSGAAAPYEVLRIDPASLQITDRIALSFADTGIPTGLAVGDGSIWVSVARSKDGHWDLLQGALLKIDEVTGDITRSAIPPAPRSISYAFGSLWLGESSGNVARIDPETGGAIDEFDAGRLPSQIVPAFDSLWIVDSYGEGSLRRIDPATGTVIATFDQALNAVSAGETAMWAQGESEAGGGIWSIDPSTEETSKINVDRDLRPVFPIVQGEGQTWLFAIQRDKSPSPGPVIPGDLPEGPLVGLPIDPETGARLGGSVALCSYDSGQPSIAYGALWVPCAREVFHLALFGTPPGPTTSDGEVTPSPSSPLGSTNVRVPNVDGLTVGRAEEALNELGLHLLPIYLASDTIRPGVVTGTTPEPGATVHAGTSVEVYASAGPALTDQGFGWIGHLFESDPDALVGLYRGPDSEGVAALSAGVDADLWTARVRQASEGRPFDVVTCSTTKPALDAIADEILPMAESGDLSKSGVAFGVQPRNCSVFVEGTFDEEMIRLLRSRFGDDVTIVDGVESALAINVPDA